MSTGVLSSVSISTTSCNESLQLTWNTDMEVNLFHAMRGHKPAGVNKHFQMIAIHERLSSACKKLTSEDVWQHLSTLYDLQALNESEIVPFPNKSSNFDLPEVDVTELGEKKFPRTPYLDSQSTSLDHTRTAEGLSTSSTPSSKNVIKNGKQEVKTPVTPVTKTEVKAEVKASSSVKSDSRSSTPSSSRGENKEHKNTSSSSSKTPQLLASASSSEPSPKRMKRTRTVPSAGASPATPNEPASKRRR